MPRPRPHSDGAVPVRLLGVLTVCFRYGEVVNINLVRDKKTGKSKGFCFLCYEDQRSTILAVDNFNGIKVSAATCDAAAFTPDAWFELALWFSGVPQGARSASTALLTM